MGNDYLSPSLFKDHNAYEMAVAMMEQCVSPNNPVIQELQKCKNMDDVRKVCLEDHDYILLFVDVFGEDNLPEELQNCSESVYFGSLHIEDLAEPESDPENDWVSDPQ